MWSSLVVQWLRLCASNEGAWVRSLVGELRSYMLHGVAPCKKYKKTKIMGRPPPSISAS